MSHLKLVVTKRSEDFVACVESDPQIFGRGRSPHSALGDLMSNHPDRFGVAITWSDGSMTANHPDRKVPA